MTRTDRPLDNPILWSVPIGVVRGIQFRLHITFLLCLAVLLWIESPVEGVGWTPTFGHLFDAIGTFLLLLIAVAVHELGHCWMTRRIGGHVPEALLWPLGGLGRLEPPNHPAGHMIAASSGLSVNIALCAISSSVLVLWLGTLGAIPWNPFHPMTPIDTTIFPTEGQHWLLRFFGINYVLVLVNLLPVFPFDGGWILQAWLWTSRSSRLATERAARFGMTSAIVVGVVGVFMEAGWLVLLIAVYGYITCRQKGRNHQEHEMPDAENYGPEISAELPWRDSESAQRNRQSGFFDRRKAEQAARRAQKRESMELFREEHVDDTLRKIARQGMSSLTRKERRLLESETRRRRESQT
ncbi:MAG: site-2 protease family protein [Planctomycetota bacterium]